jgi:hypothetical protein
MFDSTTGPSPAALTKYNRTKPGTGDRTTTLRWQQSPYTNYADGSHVEVGFVQDGAAKGGVVLRDSGNPDGTALYFSEAEYMAFVLGIDDGHLRGR